MKISIHVDKGLALQAGFDAFGRQIVQVPAAELSPAERAELINYSGSRDADYELPSGGYAIAEATPDTVHVALAGLADRRAQRDIRIRGAVEKAIERITATSPDEAIIPVEEITGRGLRFDTSRGDLYDKRTEVVTTMARLKRAFVQDFEIGGAWDEGQEAAAAIKQDPRYLAWRETMAARVAGLNADVEAKHQAAVDKATAEAEEAHRIETEKCQRVEAERDAKLEQMAAFVRKHGSANQQARLAEGLLPPEEMTASYADHVFAGAWDWPLEAPIEDADICTCEQWTDEPEYCEIDVDGGDAESLTPEEFDALAALRELLPNATIKAQQEVLTTESCHNTVRRRYLRAWHEDGQMMAIRDFAFPDAGEAEAE